MLFLLLLVIGMLIILIVKPKRSRAPAEAVPPPGSDPIGNLGAANPQPIVPEQGPDVVVPNEINGAPVAGGPMDIIQP